MVMVRDSIDVDGRDGVSGLTECCTKSGVVSIWMRPELWISRIIPGILSPPGLYHLRQVVLILNLKPNLLNNQVQHGS